MPEYRSYYALCVVLACVAVFLCSWDDLKNNDIWWHLQTGKIILQERSIPHEDSYSFTHPHAPWLNHSWLSEVFFYVVYRIGGVPGLIFLRSLIAASVALVLIWIGRIRGIGWGAATIAALVVVPSLHSRFLLRPHLFTLFGLALLIFINGLPENRRRLSQTLTFVLGAFWANCHSGVIFGFAWLSAMALGETISNIRKRSEIDGAASLLRTWVAPMLFLLATLLNPHGFLTLTYPVRMTTAEFTFKYIGEFIAPDWTLLAGNILPIVVLAAARFAWRSNRPRLGEVLAFIVFLMYAIRVRRGIALFAVVAVPWIAWTFSNLSMGISKRIGHQSHRMAVLIVLLVSSLLIWTFPPKRNAAISFRQPVDAARFIQDENLPGRFYNEIGTGGYLIWSLWPERKVFVDGRLLVYGAEFNEFQYGWIAYGAEGWENKLRNWDINYIILRYGARVAPELYRSANWILIYFDDAVMIYLKNTPQNQPWLDHWGCRMIDPSSMNFEFVRKMNAPELLQAEKEARRMVDLSPGAYRPRIVLATILGALGKIHEAEEYIKKAIETWPDIPDGYNILGGLYASDGRLEDAQRMWRRALKVDPHFLPAKLNLERLEKMQKQL